MKKPILIIFTASIILGMLGLGLNTLFGYNTVSFLVMQRTNGILYYKYDIWNYLANIKNQIMSTTMLNLTMNPREWINTSASVLDGQFWDATWNNMAFMLNWIIFGLNILIFPARIGGYIASSTFAIIGLNTLTIENNPLGWLITLAEFLEGLQIPYV